MSHYLITALFHQILPTCWINHFCAENNVFLFFLYWIDHEDKILPHEALIHICSNILVARDISILVEAIRVGSHEAGFLMVFCKWKIHSVLQILTNLIHMLWKKYAWNPCGN